MQKAFSLLELVFALLIAGVLVGVILPYFHTKTNDARILRLKAELEMVRTAVSQARNANLLQDIDAFPKVLDEGEANKLDELLFFCSNVQINACSTGSCCTNAILTRGIKASKKAWEKTGPNAYTYAITTKRKLDFKYDSYNGSFECVGKLCKAYGL